MYSATTITGAPLFSKVSVKFLMNTIEGQDFPFFHMYLAIGKTIKSFLRKASSGYISMQGLT